MEVVFLFMNRVLLYEGSSDNKKISIDKWRYYSIYEINGGSTPLINGGTTPFMK
jgi:hypothetical protein